MASFYKSSYPSDGEYVVVRQVLTIGGVRLVQGERLPSDSPVRSVPRRLRLLCEQRKLRFSSGVAAPVEPSLTKKRPARTTKKRSVKPKVDVQVATIDLESMAVKELREKADELGVSKRGTKAVLQQRIRTAMDV